MQGHLRCQERLWMWILRSQESGAGEFDFDCYPTESMHFASFSYEHDSRKSRENGEFWQLGNSFASPNPKKRLKIRNNNIDELIDPKNRFIFEPLSANMSVGDQCRSWVLGPMLQWPGEHWVVLFYFGWFRNRLMEILHWGCILRGIWISENQPLAATRSHSSGRKWPQVAALSSGRKWPQVAAFDAWPRCFNLIKSSHLQPLAATRVAASGRFSRVAASGRKWPLCRVAATDRKWPPSTRGRGVSIS